MCAWNSTEHTDDENTRYCWLRATEWGKWPIFILQPVVPILFVTYPVVPWWGIVLVVLVSNWIWALIRYNYINMTLIDLGPTLVLLKWPISIAVGVYFLVHKSYFLAYLAGLWPINTMILSMLSPPTQIGYLQKQLMMRLGYTPFKEDGI